MIINEHGAIDAKKSAKPTDKWRLVQIVFFLHGISALLPWNMLINADSYFVDYKLNPTSRLPSNCTESKQTKCIINGLSLSGNATSPANRTADSPALINYRQNFLPYLSTASKCPNIIFQLANLLFSSSHKAFSTRLVISFWVQIALFIITILLAFLDTSSWPELFFWVTMSIAVLFNTANGIFQSCVYGIGAKFPMKYINCITLGFSFSGTIASLFMIVSLLLSPQPKEVAIYYFSFATVFMLVCLCNELAVRTNGFLKYYVLLSETRIEQHPLELKKESKKSTQRTFTSYENPLAVSESDILKRVNRADAPVVEDTVEPTKANTLKSSYLCIVQACGLQLINIVLVYFVSFAIFPALQAGIRPLGSLVEDKFFAPIFCFLFFNTFATAGNYVAERILLPSPKNLFLWILLRVAFIPFFLLCNYIPGRRVWPVYVTSDAVYALGSAAMAFTGGYFSALSMMYAPKCVEPNHASTAAMMASAAVIIGILAGVQFSIVLQHIVTTWK